MGSRLDDIGVRHGTELSSLSRDCLGQWERFLAPLRDQAFDLLELGVGTGASLRTWRAWFPDARIVGLDARRLVLDPPVDDCTIVHGNQTDMAALQHVLRDHRFRFIVDDGSRDPNDQVQTFLTLFPWLEPASVYICAGLGNDAAPPLEEEEARETSRPATGAAWFADLGQALAAGGEWDGVARNWPLLVPILRKTTGVFLMRGSMVVLS